MRAYRHRHPDPQSFEPLEPRQLLGADLPFTLYYPEGFAHGGISEFVPITNPNDQPVRFELHARYQTGQRDQLVAEGTIPPRTRGGVTISVAGRPEDALVERNRAYALVLMSNRPVSATMSHYDFATAVGESFTEDTAAEWTFGDVRKGGAARDFIVYYNPNDFPVEVTLRGFAADGGQFVLRTTVDAQRRGGWNIHGEPGVPVGHYGAVLTATAPVVAAISHYETASGRGYGALGQPGGGTRTGVISAIDFSNERGFGDLPPDEGSNFPAEATINFLNTNTTEATVVLRFIGHDEARDDMGPPKTIRIAPRSSLSVDVADFGFPVEALYGIVYRADVPVTAHGVVNEGRDGTGVVGATQAATIWDFAEGFMNQHRAGGDVTEDLYLFNPTNQPIDVTITFMTGRGIVINLTRTVRALEILNLPFHETPEIRDLQSQVFYGVRVTASDAIVATMEHWDRDLGGGFSYLGMPRGDVFALDDVLVT